MDSKKHKLLNISRRFATEIEEVLADTPEASSPRTSPSSLIRRGRDLQLKQKKRKKLAVNFEDKQIQVSLCKMKVGRGGSYVRDGKSIELFAAPSCVHQQLIDLGAQNFHLKNPNSGGQSLALFSLAGAVIMPDAEWTLEAYLKKIHKSDARLGVGYIDSEDSSSEHPSSDSDISKHSVYCDSVHPDTAHSPHSSLPRVLSSFGDNPSHPVTILDDIDGDDYVRPKFHVVPLKPSDSAAGKKDTRASRTPAPSIDSGKCMQFDPKELADATCGYKRSNLIGRGGYGTVYRGRLRGCLDVAIKVLTVEGQRALARSHPTAQMQAEVTALTRFRHPNILPLCGYCLKPPIIVYELMRGSLYGYIHEESKNLSWDQRVHILEGTCKGLLYLHSADQPIVHQDIKSANILLDSAMNAKLADFGFAVELPQLSHGTTVFSANFIARSDGYFPSEITSGNFSDRSDVYSYGIVVLETFTGQLVYNPKRPDKKLSDHLQDELSNFDDFKGVFDPKLPPDDIDGAPIYKIITLCLKTHSKRPSAAGVLAMWSDLKTY